MNIVIISGSPRQTSRSEILAQQIADNLKPLGATARRYRLSDFDAQLLVDPDFNDASIRRFQADVEAADAVILATPVYQASFAGGLKLLIDLLPQRGLTDKTTIAVATGGSRGHQLVLDYALAPVVSALGAAIQLPGVYATELDFSHTPGQQPNPTEATRARLHEASVALLRYHQRFPSSSNPQSHLALASANR